MTDAQGAAGRRRRDSLPEDLSDRRPPVGRVMSDDQAEDLEVPRAETEAVKGGVAAGDLTGDGPAALRGDPDQPIVAGTVPRKLPGLHKAADVTLKRG